MLYIHSTHTQTLTYCIRFPQRARAACGQWKLFTLMSIYNNWPIALISRYDQTKSCPGQARKNTTARGVPVCESVHVCVCVWVSVCMWFDHESPDKSCIKSAWLFISKCLGIYSNQIWRAANLYSQYRWIYNIYSRNLNSIHVLPRKTWKIWKIVYIEVTVIFYWL